jgi:hypothetical protein
MEGVALIKTSELTELLNEIKSVKEEVKRLREQEENLKAYSIQQTADLLSLHYNSVRKLVLSRKLFAKFLEGESGKCTIPAWAIKEYLHKQEERKKQMQKSKTTLKEFKDIQK